MMYFSYQVTFLTTAMEKPMTLVYICFLHLFSASRRGEQQCGSTGTSHLIWTYIHDRFCLKIPSFPVAFSPHWPTTAPDGVIAPSLCEPNPVSEEM